MYLNTRIFQTTGYARVLLFMFIRRELGGTGTGCLFQYTYCDMGSRTFKPERNLVYFRLKVPVPIDTALYSGQTLSLILT